MKDNTNETSGSTSRLVDFLNHKTIAALSILLSFISYILPIFPEEYKMLSTFGFLFLAIVSVTYSKIEDLIMVPLIKRYCPEGEKTFRYLSQEKVVTVYPDGKGLIHIKNIILNEQKDSVVRFPNRITTSTPVMGKNLKDLEDEGNFSIQSLDSKYGLHWEPVIDNDKKKLVCIVFSEDIKPGEERTYSVRYELPGLFKTKAEELENDSKEFTGVTPIFIIDKYRLKVKFYPNYKYKDVAYCVRSPSGDKCTNKCYALEPQRDIDTGGTFFEIQENNLWRNFSHRIEWTPDN